jgi:hypothetical protein
MAATAWQKLVQDQVALAAFFSKTVFTEAACLATRPGADAIP